MMRLRQEVAKKYELGQHNTRKKPRKDDDMEGRSLSLSGFVSHLSPEEEMLPTEIFIPTFRPNPQIQYENTPLSKSTWKTQRCPLAGCYPFLFFLLLPPSSRALSLSSQRLTSLPSRRSPRRMSSLPSPRHVEMTWRAPEAPRSLGQLCD
jgi:hypothetical protein